MNTDFKQNKLNLKFQNSEFEKTYVKVYDSESLKTMRMACLIAVFLLILFSIPDFSDISFNKTVILIRYLFVVPLVIAGYLSTFSKYLRKYVQFSFCSIIFLGGITILYQAFHEMPENSVHYLGYSVFTIIAYTYSRLRFSYAVTTSLLLLINYAICISWLLLIEGHSEMTHLFLSYGLFYLVVNIVGFFSVYSVEKLHRSFYLQKKIVEANIIELAEKNEIITTQNTKIEDLLHNILPVQIVSEFKEGKISKPILNRDSTIVFTDFVSFSSFAERTDPKIVVNNLDMIFKKFDDIVKSKGLEKLKTIGDSYMFAGGLFTESCQIAECIEACNEIIEFIKENQAKFTEQTGYDWSIRIGLSIGPVVTGLIGNWRLLYDTWGNTVNIASRLEENSGINRINVCKNVFDRLKDSQIYNFTYRGSLPVKNMHPIEMYFIDFINN